MTTAVTTNYVRAKLDELDEAKRVERAARQNVADLTALVKQLHASNEITDPADKQRAQRLLRPQYPRRSGTTRSPRAHR
jgi:hypothetical protein